MFTSVMEPALRPTIVILLDETGDHVYQRLTSLAAGLDAATRRALAIVRYGPPSRRLPAVLAMDRDAEVSDETGGRVGPVSGDPASGPIGAFNAIMFGALVDVMDVRNLDRIRRTGMKTPDPLAQLIVVGRADYPYLGRALSEARQALAEAAVELGATIRLESPILCALADYRTTSRAFTQHVKTIPLDALVPAPEDTNDLQGLYHSPADTTAPDDWGADGEEFTGFNGGADHAPPATFQFLYARLTQDARATMSEDLVEYIMAEAVFSLAATGQTFASSMAEVTRAVPGVSATKDRVGSLGACMIRFPRAEVVRFCVASLGADLLDYWSERERAALRDPEDRARLEARKEEQREAASRFVEETLTPWIRGDILDTPAPGLEGWPDTGAFTDATLSAGKSLGATRDRMEGLITREEIDDRVAALDISGDARRQPELLAELWRSVTDQAWRDYEDIHESQIEPVTTAAYRAIREELASFLDRHVDDIWLNPDQGWEAAEAYAERMGDDLYNVAMENLDRDRVAADQEYERLLLEYEERIAEAFQDFAPVEGGDGLPGDGFVIPQAQGNYDSIYREEAAPEDVRADAYHTADASLYNEAATMPRAAGSASPGGGFTPGDDLTGGYPPPTAPGAGPNDPAAVGDGPIVEGEVVQEQPAPEEPEQPLTRAQREERVLSGMGDLVARRLLDRRLIAPSIALALVAAPALTLIVLAQLVARWPLSVGLVAAIVAGVAVALGALILGLWLRARRRSAEAMRWHIELMQEIALRRQRDIEDQLRVFVINRALANVREMREHLSDWPQRVQTLANQLREQAQTTSDDLFNGPAGYHDILIANGARLLPPDTQPDERAPDQTPGQDSPLWPIYLRFSDDRSRHPLAPWHGSLDSILDALRASFHTGRGGVIRISDEDFRSRLMRFLRGSFSGYLQGEIGRISAALDLTRNPQAGTLWRAARAHAAPPHGAPGGETFYVAGQPEDIDATAKLGLPRSAQRIATRLSQPNSEWLLTTTLRRGGIPI